MKKATVEVPAKINLTLDILGVRAGYHEIESLAASIDLVDAVAVSPKKSGFTLKETGLKAGCPADKNNAVRAARAFFAHCGGKAELDGEICCGAEIHIDKKIPLGGGLGGSSADAAGVILALCRIFGKDMLFADKVAADVGSDVNYMLRGGYAVMRGRGERVERINAETKLYLVVVLSDKPVDTGRCYALCDEMKILPVHGTARAVGYLFEGETAKLKGALFNAMTAAAETLNGEVREHLAAVEAVGGKAGMSGSGGTVYGVFDDEAERDAAFTKLHLLYGEKILKAETLP